tara:strand:+ start:2714 stop:3841 length:1128 start_codon:yes stop_codon:yes gene_type:complete
MNSSKKFIPVYQPYIQEEESKVLQDCVNTGWISSKGKYIDLFEKSFAKYLNAKYALTTSNGTVALHLALATIGIKEGDEVLVPNLTFAASVNSIIYTGATPVLIDCDPDSFNMDTNLIEDKITSKTKAIMVVHLYGLPVNMDIIKNIADKHNLIIIEDSAESFGSEFKGKKVGTFGRVSTFSFYGNKTITTGEGGMIIFKSKKDYDKAKILRDHGMSPNKTYWHEFLGFNYRMTNLQASVGYAQLKKSNLIIEKKINLAQNYIRRLKKIDGIKFQQETDFNKNTYWLVTIIVEENKFGASRDSLMSFLKKNNIDSRPVFFPINLMPPYQKYNIGSFPASSHVSKNGLSLPSFPSLSNDKIKMICDLIIDYHNNPN